MRSPVFLAALLLASLASFSSGEEPGRGKSESKPPASRDVTAAVPCPADDRVAGFGLRAFIDPQTGQLREPTPEEIRSLAQAPREQFVRELATLEEVVHPDGMISLDLKGLFMQDLVVVRRLDGSLVMRCVPDSEKDTALFEPPPPPPPAAPKLEER
jgi:hypothetical protein